MPASLTKIRSKVTQKSWGHHFLHYKSMGSRANNSKVNDPKCPKFEIIRASMLLVTCTFDKDIIKGGWAKLETYFFTAQGHVTPKRLDRYDWNSNSSEILCLSSLPVSLMKTKFMVTERRWMHHFPHSKLKSDLAQIRTHIKVIYKGIFKSFIVLYADRICPEHHFVENRIENFPSV